MASNLQDHEQLCLAALSILQLSRQSSFPGNSRPRCLLLLALFLNGYLVVPALAKDVCQACEAAGFRAFIAAILKSFVLPAS